MPHSMAERCGLFPRQFEKTTGAEITGPCISPKSWTIDVMADFTRHDILQRVKPVLEKRLEDAQATERSFVVLNVRLGDYDFEGNAFPTGLAA